MPNNQPHPERLLRLRGVLTRVPVSKSTWWNWVRTGRAPQPVRIGGNTTCWCESDIEAFIRNAATKEAA